jgi:hypothetical protein
MTIDTDFKCKYCGKTFRKLTTLTVHNCELKRRYLQENETGVRIGFQTFCRFFELTQYNAKTKSYSDFVKSSYYSSFVKFGQYIVQIRPVNTTKFIDWIVQSNIKLDNWTKDEHYHKFVIDYLPKEPFDDAMERTLKEIQQWADKNNEQFFDFFKKTQTREICGLISEGRISPWVIFNCKSGHDFLSNLHESQLAALINYLNPDIWNSRFNKYKEEVDSLKSILKNVGM